MANRLLNNFLLRPIDIPDAYHDYRFRRNLRVVLWVSVGIVVLTFGLLALDIKNYYSGVWEREPQYLTLAILRFGLLVSLSVILIPQRKRNWDKKITYRDKILNWVLIGYILAWCVATTVIGSSIHGQITIFTVAVLTGGSVLILRTYEAIWAFGLSFLALIGGLYAMPGDPMVQLGSFIGASTVTVIAIFIAIYNYRRTAASYKDRQTILHQKKKLETLNADIEALLKEREQELQDFIYASSHDLRAPVVEMKGLWEIFKNEEGLNEHHLSYLEEAKEHTRSLDGYTRNLIGVMETRRQELKSEKIDSLSLINSCLSQLVFLEDEVVPAFEIAADNSPVIIGDRYRLWLMLTNLLENAVRFQRKDEPNPMVFVRMVEDHGLTTVEVRDNGQGMSPDFLKNIWKRFSRGVKGKVGAGLGLFVVKEVVESLGGEFQIQSEEGKGTRIFLIFGQKQIAN
ncbi:MAG: HAMP domain-containing sensor histidine kinase [Bacteroidia bacterium]